MVYCVTLILSLVCGLTPSPRVICQIQRTDAARLRREVQTGAATGTLPPRWSVVGRVRK